MSAATASQPAEPAPLSILHDQSAPSEAQRTGNGVLVNGLAQRRPFGIAWTAKTARVGGKRNHKTLSRKQAIEFADTCHQMLRRMRHQLGITSQDGTAFDPIHTATTNGQVNGKEGCESLSNPTAPSDAPPITRDDAQIVGLITRGWDTAQERLRVLSGVPDPGCRRPGEPVPKSRKPTNRAPDSLACGSDTPTGSVPQKI